MARTSPALDQRLLAVFDDREVVSYADLREHVDVTPRTVQRHLNVLVDTGLVVRLAKGLYSRRPHDVELNDEAEGLLTLLRESDADAHLTGFDVLAPFAHQFVYDYAHLIYCHPTHISGLASELADAGWRVVPAGPRRELGGEEERMVVLRRQTHDESRFPVRNHLAAPEKAWVDLLREVRRSRLAFDFVELGRILNAMQASGARLDALKAYARRAGYLEWVRAALGERKAESVEQRQLAAGYAA